MRGKPFKKGNTGRPIGAKNKYPLTVKQSIVETFMELQADPKFNMLAWAKSNTSDFYKIASKLIPIEVRADHTTNSPMPITGFVITTELPPPSEATNIGIELSEKVKMKE